MNPSDYNDLKNSLGESLIQQGQLPNIENTIQEGKEVIKGTLTGMGTFLEGQAVTKLIKKAGGKKEILKNAKGKLKQKLKDQLDSKEEGEPDEDIEAGEAAEGEGDNLFGGFLNTLKSRFLSRVKPPTNEINLPFEDDDDWLANTTMRNALGSGREAGTKDPFKIDDDDTDLGLQRPSTIYQRGNIQPKAPDNDALQQAANDSKNAADDTAKAAGDDIDNSLVDLSKVATKATKVEEGIDAVTEGSLAFDETGFGIGVTALLGLGSLIAGAFLKSHHMKDEKLPYVPPTNYSVQQGA
tara:strand:- start:88 stop:978 length:891 start_codon:yes stop_codon:yes gene_type:complete